jgi:RNA-directed DNA polymerase
MGAVTIPPVEGNGVTGAQTARERQTPSAWSEMRALTNNLMEWVCEEGNLWRACHQVVANDGAPGCDGMTVQELPDWLKENQQQLRKELLEDKYQPEVTRGKQLDKPGGGIRQLAIPDVVDRLVTQALKQVMEPAFDPDFSDSNFGYREGRSAQDAIRQAREYVREGRNIAVDLDLEKFFDRVNHDILMSRLARKIGDKRVLSLIRRFLEAGMMQDGVVIEREEGTPQGSPLSPLLANVLLDELDKELEARGHRFCRYADDCNIYVRSEAAGQRVLTSVTEWIESKLKLRVNRQKSASGRTRDRKFLGYRLIGSIVTPAKANIKRFKDKVRKITKRKRGRSSKQVIAELNALIRGWVNYFSLTSMKGLMRELDGWIRRRMRALVLKHLKKPKAVWKFLHRRGVGKIGAAQLASSGKGYWRLAHSPQAEFAMPPDWFERNGLLSMVKLYEKVHVPG